MDNEKAKEGSSNQDVRSHIQNSFIQWARMKGYSDSTGFLVGLVFLSKGPLSLDELCQETGYSKSTVSSNMNLLERLGLVKRIMIRGDKRHIYAPITDPLLIRNIILSSINTEIQIFGEDLEKTENEIKAGGEEVRYLLERVAALRNFCEQGRKIVDILGKQPLNTKVYQKSLEQIH
ncbi:MAG: MarR family transcriptional regulator [Methanothrix sp.]|nr:MarR family transcriptional regulator [Methanothrix sp.]